jgi:hypothetical protein
MVVNMAMASEEVVCSMELVVLRKCMKAMSANCNESPQQHHKLN